ncbi:MAG TPA: alpha/beta fold hydrolase [Thermoanaerobaculia bacterium]|nr:alpha/beta fold hydrolase [Thermoanaerobaculia bacterium]
MNGEKVRQRRLIRWIGFVAVNLLLIGVIAAGAFLYGWARFARSLPDLRGWHRQAPAAEFHEANARPGYTFEDYLKQESEAFKQLGALVDGPWTAEAVGEFDRFRSGSVSNPEKTLDRNWNRSFVLQAAKPIGGALLVHGLSDSPYSLRALAERLHAEGYTVVGLRVPGHGTCPRALAEVSWKDWTAAVRVAAAGVRRMIPAGAPLILAGYSNGGALSVHYATSALEDKSLPPVSGVVLFSPMIGITPFARVSGLYHIVARLSGDEKALWSDVSAEVDPFKYCSWPMNASEQAWALTQEVERRLSAIQRSGRMGQMPPILAMQSAIDSTVAVPRMITVLFDRLEKGGASELVLFDVNRIDRLNNLMDLSFEREIRARLQRKDLPFRLTVVRNSADDSRTVTAQTRTGDSWTEMILDEAWPRGVFSLSHVAVPFPPTDPVYGTAEATAKSGLPLGSLTMRGENGALLISDSMLIRQRNNPFYRFMADHVVKWLSENAKPR